MGYIPTKDADLLNWGRNYSDLITADPVLYGLDAADAAIIQTNFDEFDAAYALAIDPPTRTFITVALKDEQRAGFLGIARGYAAIIRANQGVAPEDKAALGLNIPDPTPTPIPAPSTFPILVVPLAGPGQALLSITDELTPSVKAKPFGVAGALLWRADAAGVIPDFDAARVIRILTRADNIIDTSDVTVGNITRYWAQWFSRKGEFGPIGPSAQIVAL